MVANIQLKNSILGWQLIPLDNQAIETIAKFYFFSVEEYQKTPPADLAFCKDEPISSVKQHIKDVAKGMDASVSFCGNLLVPKMRVWFKQKFACVEPEKFSIDLKWSCWSSSKQDWDERYPGLWDRIEKSFLGTEKPVEISTGPRKEIRYGTVTIGKGFAEGYFCTNWDDLETLADTLNTVNDEAFNETIPFSIKSMEPGVDNEFFIKARKFQNLMKRIDQEESQLLANDQKEWEMINRMFLGK